MAERKTFSRYNMRCGIVLRAPEGKLKIDGFDLPEIDPRFLILTAKDIPGENVISVMGTNIPLLADTYIAYKGQPLVALFGPDYESTELLLEKIKIRTSPMDLGVTEETAPPSPLFFSWGLDDEVRTEKEKQGMRKIESSYSVCPSKIVSYVRNEVLSWIDSNGLLHIECPTQWPELVRKTVAQVTGLSSESIIISNKKFKNRYDEFLLTPTILAAFAAIASIKTKMVSEMKIDVIGRRTGIDFQMTTWLDEENRPKHEEITATVNQGAYSINGKEVQSQIMAGIIPKYSLDSFKAIIRIETKADMPTLFAGSSLYAFSTAATNFHLSRVAKKGQITPLKFILDTCKETTKFTDWAPKHDLVELNNKMKNIAILSDYERKWSSTSLHAGEFGLQGYLYGIGISSALSIGGFSTSYAKANNYQTQICYTSKKNITVLGTIPTYISQDRVLREIISKYFPKNGTSETVFFIDTYNKRPDSGPNVLSFYDTVFLTQLMKAANKLAQLMEENKTDEPIETFFSSQNLTIPCEFEYSGFGSGVCEVEIKKTSLVPVAKKLWIDMALALPYTKNAIQKIKATAIETLSSLGTKLADNFSINVNLTPEKKEVNVYSSLDNLTRALVTSAYSSAIWQALGEDANISLPLGAKRIEAILSGGKDK